MSPVEAGPNPRAADREARARRLVDEALSTGEVQLPTLTREELAALGSLESGPWRDADDLSWWAEMTEEARTAVTVGAIRGLGARGLLDLTQPAADAAGLVQLAPEPELGSVLAARVGPAFVVVGGEPDAGQLGRFRLYGVAEGGGLRCLVTELVEDNGLHRFALRSPGAGFAAFAEWACAPATQVDAEGRPRPPVRTLEVVRPRAEGPLVDRLLVLVGTQGVAVSEVGDDDQPGEPSVTTPDQLSRRLEGILAHEAGG